MNRTAVFFAVIASSSALAHADIVRVSEFESEQFEGFQGLSLQTFDPGKVAVFDNMATVFNTSGSWVHSTSAWSFDQRVSAYEGNRMLGSSRGGIGYEFVNTQRSFGAFFASISEVSDGQIRFYNGTELVGSDTLAAPSSQEWAWNGWSSDRAFNRVEVDSNHSSRGFIMHDAVRVLSAEVPAPGGGVLLLGGVLTIARRRR